MEAGSEHPRSSLRSSLWLLFVGAIVLTAFFRNGTTPLWDQDEAAYAGFARHMLQSGDWVVPEFMWSAVHRKPPLVIWCMAVSCRLFGESEFALRLPTTLAMLGTFLTLWRLGRKLFGEATSRLAALVLATSLLLPNMGKLALPDCWLLLFETLAALALLQAIETPKWRWTVLFWMAVSLGLLAKGPPILVVAGGLFAWAAVTHPQRRNLLRLHPWLGLPLALVPLLLWGKLAWDRTHGEMIRWMLDWYVLRRLKGGSVFGQVGPPGYHLLMMFLGLLPWSALLPAASGRLREHWAHPRGRFLVGWLIFGWLLWEAMPSKLPAYAVGAYPAVALLLADELQRLEASSWHRHTLQAGAWIVVVAALALGMAVVSGVLFLAPTPMALTSAGLLLAGVMTGTVLAVRALREGKTGVIISSFAASGLLCTFLCWLGIVPAFDQRRGLGPAVEQAISRAAAPDARVVYAGDYRLPSVPYYVGRTHPSQVVAETETTLQRLLTVGTGYVFVLQDETFQRVRASFPFVTATRIDGWKADSGRPQTLWVLTEQGRPAISNSCQSPQPPSQVAH